MGLPKEASDELPSQDFKLFLYNHPAPSAAPGTPITLNHNSYWTHCGPLLDPKALPPSFHAWSRATINGNILPALLPFLAFAHAFLGRAHLQHYWLTIRATRPTAAFDLPRWHTDTEFLDRSPPASGTQWKLAATLLGPGTLFVADGAGARAAQGRARRELVAAAGEHVCRELRCLGCTTVTEGVRARLAEEFGEMPVVQARSGEGCFFRLEESAGAVHSEPRCGVDRVFVNLIPGSEREMIGLLGKWGMEYPRTWSVDWLSSEI
jgi:hypothetical protein